MNALLLIWLRDYLLPTCAIMAGVYAVATWLLVRATRACIRRTPTPFAETFDEIKKDARALRPDHE